MATRYNYIKNLSLEEMAGEMVIQQFAGMSTILLAQGYKKETIEDVLKEIHNTVFEHIIECLETEID